MTQFFFHLHECGTITQDEEGSEFPDLEGARAKAIKEAREIMCAEVAEGRLCLTCSIEIVAPDGVTTSVKFRDAIEITGL